MSTPNGSFLNLTHSLACFPLNNYNHLCPARSMHVYSLHLFPDHSSLVPQYEDQPKLVRLDWRLPLLGPSTSTLDLPGQLIHEAGPALAESAPRVSKDVCRPTVHTACVRCLHPWR